MPQNTMSIHQHEPKTAPSATTCCENQCSTCSHAVVTEPISPGRTITASISLPSLAVSEGPHTCHGGRTTTTTTGTSGSSSHGACAACHEARANYQATKILYADILLLVLAVFLPPLVVYFKRGCGCHLCLNILLWILGWVPSAIHAWYLVVESGIPRVRQH